MFAALLRTMRPHQWVKNFFVLTPLLFAQRLFDYTAGLRTLAGFWAFCLTASAVYVVNDLLDREADRAHPVKRNRPIASGQLPITAAWSAAAVIGAAALGLSLRLGLVFAGTVAAYLVLNLAYGLWLKRVPYLDVFCIAAGFELRVLAGASAAQVPASGYLLAVTFLLALFLALGKRMHELNQGVQALKQRSVLRSYSKSAVAALLYASAGATVATYVAYTLDAHTRSFFQTDYLVFTSPFALLGILRFLKLVHDRPDAESPTEEMLRDVPFLTNLAFWTISIFIAIYSTRI
jgi:4-hydroxybenzoate polyprenyltransferase